MGVLAKDRACMLNVHSFLGMAGRTSALLSNMPFTQSTFCMTLSIMSLERTLSHEWPVECCLWLWK